jgi:hypothetical protein
MKNPCKALLAYFFLALPLTAQEGDGLGFLNIVNLIPGDIPADVTIAGKTLSPEGLLAGSDTGWFMVPIGKKPMTIALEQPGDTKPRIDEASGEIELLEGLANVIAIYLQPDKRVKPDGTPFPPKIRIRSFPAYDGAGFALRLISTCPADNRFQIGPKVFDAKPFESVEIPGWSGAPFEIMRNGKTIGKATGSSEKGSFYVFIGHDGKDGYVTATTRAATQEVPPWMKKEKKKPSNPGP